MELGGGVTRSSVTTTVDNPYTISNLWYNCKVNAFVNVEDPRTTVTNMANYAMRKIPNYRNITEIPNGHLPIDINTKTAYNWSSAFNDCRNLTSLPDPFYDTSNATKMTWMFYSCRNLTTIPNFDTSNVTNMGLMFTDCENLITVPNFDTSKVTNMSTMFMNCKNLTIAPNFNTGSVTNMYQMFIYCENLRSIPVLNLSSVTQLYAIYGTGNDIGGNLYIESNTVTSASSMFTSGKNAYIKNIYCHANTTTYRTIYINMGNTTYSSSRNAYLLTMEDNYAYINWTGEGIYRFPTNKIQVMGKIIEVTPYTDYNLTYNYGVYHGNTCWCSRELTSTMWANFFTFFKDITNMTANVVDII